MGVLVGSEREGANDALNGPENKKENDDDKKKLQRHYKSIMSAVKRANNQFSCCRNQVKRTSSVAVIY